MTWVLVALIAQDLSELERMPVQHRDRLKPFDSMAREFLSEWTGKEKAPRGPSAAILDIVFKPDEAKAQPWIRIQHPDLRKQLGLGVDRDLYSLTEIEATMPVFQEIFHKAQDKKEKDRGALDRAVLSLATAYTDLEMMRQGFHLRMIPIEYGPDRTWVSPFFLQRYLAMGAVPAGHEVPPEWTMVVEALERAPRAKLEEISAAYDQLREAWRNGAGVPEAVARFAKAVRDVNPSLLPDAKRMDSEVRYNKTKPFSWSAALYGLTFVLFVFSIVFSSRVVWGAGIVSLIGAIGTHLYAYMWRWEIAQRFPLSNQYEAMLALAFLGAVMALIFELVLRSKYFGLAAGLVGAIMILLADAVTDFSPYIKSLPPALQSIWMTIHVPTILMGYVCGAIMAVLGHIYIFTYLWAPSKEETMKHLETYMYRILQVTVLFLLAGTILGGVWAKEAWGRFWGWDMKETWALISLLGYLAILHARFAGAIKGLGTAVGSIVGVTLVFLTFYGVNFLFGRGLHTYGFGAGSMGALVGFFAFEALVAGAGIVVHVGRNRTPEPGPGAG